jgi:hypothetical protein
MAKIFKLLHLPHVEFPRAFSKHGVGFSGDFVVPVPSDVVDAEIQRLSAIEVAAAMWSEGWCPVAISSKALAYCVERSRVQEETRAPPLAFFWADEAEFEFLLRNLDSVTCRRNRKAFLAPFPDRSEVLISSTVIDSLGVDFGRGELPPYTEFPSPGEFFEVATARMLCG